MSDAYSAEPPVLSSSAASDERRGDGARSEVSLSQSPESRLERRRNPRDDVFVEDVDEDVDAVVAAALDERRAVHVRAESSR